MRRIACLFLALLLALSVPAYAAGEDPAAGRREDLDLLYDTLKAYHPNLFANTTEEALLAKKAEIEGRLASVDDATFALDLQSLVAMIGDSHTTTSLSTEGCHLYPVGIEHYAEGWVVTVLPQEDSACIGWRVEAVNGLNMEGVMGKLASILSSDNPVRLRRQVAQAFGLAELFAYVGITEQNGLLTMDLSGPEGEREQLTLSALPIDDRSQWPALARLIPEAVPVTAAQDRFYFSLDLGSAYYIQYNTCREDPELPMETFAAQVAEDLAEKDYDKVLIDLRSNGGGSDGVLVPILTLLAPMVRSGEVEVWGLIGEATFSSAAINAMEIREMGGFLAGEATSGSVDHFGAVGTFTLPNSGIRGQFSTKYITLSDYLECAVGLGVTAIEPDWAVPQTLEDDLAGRDTAVEALLARTESFVPEEEPDAPLSRGRFTAMLRQAVGAQADTWGMPFDDVFPFNWYVPDLLWAVDSGIVTGEAEGIFDPAGIITWEEAVVLAERYLDAAGADVPIVRGGEAPDWVEAAAHAWAVQYVEDAWRHGLLPEGYDLLSAMERAEGQALLDHLAECLQ